MAVVGQQLSESENDSTEETWEVPHPTSFFTSFPKSCDSRLKTLAQRTRPRCLATALPLNRGFAAMRRSSRRWWPQESVSERALCTCHSGDIDVDPKPCLRARTVLCHLPRPRCACIALAVTCCWLHAQRFQLRFSRAALRGLAVAAPQRHHDSRLFGHNFPGCSHCTAD